MSGRRRWCMLAFWNCCGFVGVHYYYRGFCPINDKSPVDWFRQNPIWMDLSSIGLVFPVVQWSLHNCRDFHPLGACFQSKHKSPQWIFMNRPAKLCVSQWDDWLLFPLIVFRVFCCFFLKYSVWIVSNSIQCAFKSAHKQPARDTKPKHTHTCSVLIIMHDPLCNERRKTPIIT